jgi:hypothetical protein
MALSLEGVLHISIESFGLYFWQSAIRGHCRNIHPSTCECDVGNAVELVVSLGALYEQNLLQKRL